MERYRSIGGLGLRMQPSYDPEIGTEPAPTGYTGDPAYQYLRYELQGPGKLNPAEAQGYIERGCRGCLADIGPSLKRFVTCSPSSILPLALYARCRRYLSFLGDGGEGGSSEVERERPFNLMS